MNSEAISAILSKQPALKASKAKLEAMEPGSYVVHRSWGFGQIKDYDDADQKLVIDFKGKKGHRMDPSFCVGSMDVLSPKHILARKETEPAKIKQLIEDDPVQLVIDTLSAYPNNAASAIELEIVLAQVVGDEKFKKWFTSVKKQLIKDPRVGVPAKKTELYVLRDEPVTAESEIMEEFSNTRSARRRISLAEDLLAASIKDEAKQSLGTVLNGITEAVRDSNQLDAAERLYGAFVRDELAKILGHDVGANSPNQSELIKEVRGLPAIAEKIPVHFQSRFLDLVKETHPLEWREITFALLKTSQGKFTTECINFLLENGQADELAAVLKRWKTEQNLRAPVLLWIIKNRHSKKFGKLLHDLINPRLLGAIFFAIDYEALQSAGTRRIPLAEALSDDAELISDLLATADTETARDLGNSLLLNQGFEELTKKSLLARFIKLFPSLQSLVSGEADSKEDQLLVSRDSYEKKRVEYEEIVSKRIPDNSKAIATAREHGDLKENSEFKMAKQDQSVLMGQKAQLERDLARARITDFAEATTDQVSVGTVVDLRDVASGKAVRYSVLGAWDSDPETHRIAYKTPLGQALLGRKVGEHVKLKIGGVQHEYQLAGITRFVDAKS
ncbi:transcription elongation factor GreAB [Oleiharenicola lentus]|uniref:Transcription elongation factor GreAB n=1 Tax=Oleiharenicola lentus TaxID=2508720 RepID=A0A4V1M5Z6_9BACT|nr:GreA/GreB family elongation factor [Oleiharenicola lentus]RXK53246.1 transcription elongation factor GreAB [Oleiharenicola lentus]